ncbi:MAG: sortase [Caldilineaceae bacterium]
MSSHSSLGRHIGGLFLLSAVLLGLLTACGGAPVGPADLPEASPIRSVESAMPHPRDGTNGEETFPDRLEIPAINADMPVVKLGWHPANGSDDAVFSEWDVAEYAAGWHKNSALPGETGNVVMSGHNNILGSVFRELDQLRAGDDIYVGYGGQRYQYVVDQVVIVPEKYASTEQRQENAKWIGESKDSRLTLVSCWPRNNNTHRIVVVARPVDDHAGQDTVRAADEIAGQ